MHSHFFFNVVLSRFENTRWFKYDRDYLCVNKSQFVPVIFEPPLYHPRYAKNIRLKNVYTTCLKIVYHSHDAKPAKHIYKVVQI
jgi:hypothetical protein